MNAHKQRGASLLGVATTLLIIGGIAFIGIKVSPIYFEFFRVNTAMEKLAAQPEVGKMTSSNVKRALIKRLVIDDVDSVRQKQIFVTREDGIMYVNVKYEKRNEALETLDLVGKYDKTIEIKIPQL